MSGSNRKFGRNKNRPCGGANQKTRTEKNKRKAVEAEAKKAGAKSSFAELPKEARFKGKPKRSRNEYTAMASRLSPLGATS